MKVKSLILKEDEFEDVYGEMDQPFANTFVGVNVLESAGSMRTSKVVGEVKESKYIQGKGIQIISEVDDCFIDSSGLNSSDLCPAIVLKDGSVEKARNVFFSIASDDMVGETVKYTPSVLNNGLYE